MVRIKITIIYLFDHQAKVIRTNQQELSSIKRKRITIYEKGFSEYFQKTSKLQENKQTNKQKFILGRKKTNSSV